MIKIGGSKTEAPKLAGYSSYALETKSGDWILNLTGIAYQQPPYNLRQKMLIKMLARVMHASHEDLSSENFKSRIRPFFVEADKGNRMNLLLGDASFRLKKKSRRNGRFDNWIRLQRDLIMTATETLPDGRSVLNYKVSAAHPESVAISGQADLISRRGVSVISDIDDTIKDSDVGDRRQLLMNTFVRDFRCIDGMADIYGKWQREGVSFHYVSSSPWQLFEPLSHMRRQFDFPAGTMHLRNFRLRDQFLSKLMFRREGKSTVIRRLVKNLPDRKFILIGDSGEKDPEIYGKICRKYPDRIVGVFIRNLDHRPMSRDRIGRIRTAEGATGTSVFSDPEKLSKDVRPILEQWLAATRHDCLV